MTKKDIENGVHQVAHVAIHKYGIQGVAAGVGAVALGAGEVVVAAAPILIPAAVVAGAGYGVYKMFKWLGK